MATLMARVLVHEYEDGGVARGTMLSSLVQLAAMPANTSMMEDLRRRLHTSKGSAGDPFGVRKIVDLWDGEGYRPTVIPDIPGIEDAALSEYEDEAGAEYMGEIYDGEAKIFDLGQIFSDTNISDKLGFTARFSQYLKRIALEQPSKAASMLQDRLRKEGYPNYTIRAGRYAKSRAQASSRLLAAAAASKVPCVSVAAEVAGDKLFLHQAGVDGLVEWTVYGPIQNASVVRAVYQLCLAVGIHEPVFAYSLDLQILDITVQDCVSGMVVSPSFVEHVGPAGVQPEGHVLPVEISDRVKEVMVAHESCVLPVTCDGLVIGSAVRITGRYLLISEHVLNYEPDVADGGLVSVTPSETDGFGADRLRVAGKKFVQRNSVSKDLWVIELAGEAVDWVYREPRIGEKVLMCYSVGDSVEYTSVSRVQSYNQNMFAASHFPQARHGTSGGVVVSAQDGALLGVYNGEALTSSMCSGFSPFHFGTLAELDSLSDSNTQSDVTNRLYDRIESRGLRAIVERIVGSISPLFDSIGFRGVAVKFHDKLYTTVDPDKEQLFLMDKSSRHPVVFDAADRNRYVSRGLALMASAQLSIGFSRSVELNEKVFVVACDAEGPYMSSSRRVDHVGASGGVFHVKDFGISQLLFDGGVVVAERDGAVVGQFVSRVDGLDYQLAIKRAMCYGAPVDVVTGNVGAGAVKRVVDGITVKFPFLNPLTWSTTAVLDVFTHGSVRTTGNAMERFSAIGGAAAKMQLFRSMNSVGLAHKEWTDIWKSTQNNSRLAEICHDVGIAELLIVASHTQIGKTSRVYADLLEAFIGLVVEYESSDKFQEVCKVLGLLYDANTPVLVTAFSRQSRSASPVDSTQSVITLSTNQVLGGFSSSQSRVSPLAQIASLQEQLNDLTRIVGVNDVVSESGVSSGEG